MVVPGDFEFFPFHFLEPVDRQGSESSGFLGLELGCCGYLGQWALLK